MCRAISRYPACLWLPSHSVTQTLCRRVAMLCCMWYVTQVTRKRHVPRHHITPRVTSGAAGLGVCMPGCRSSGCVHASTTKSQAYPPRTVGSCACRYVCFSRHTCDTLHAVAVVQPIAFGGGCSRHVTVRDLYDRVRWCCEWFCHVEHVYSEPRCCELAWSSS